METLKEFLFPILQEFVGATCTKSLLALDLENKACIKLLISKVLSAGILAGSCIVKVPQILKIKSTKSTAGLSAASYILQNISIIIALAYNYRLGNPFSTVNLEVSLIFIVWGRCSISITECYYISTCFT